LLGHFEDACLDGVAVDEDVADVVLHGASRLGMGE
jgi:hypothetical protein